MRHSIKNCLFVIALSVRCIYSSWPDNDPRLSESPAVAGDGDILNSAVVAVRQLTALEHDLAAYYHVIHDTNRSLTERNAARFELAHIAKSYGDYAQAISLLDDVVSSPDPSAPRMQAHARLDLATILSENRQRPYFQPFRAARLLGEIPDTATYDVRVAKYIQLADLYYQGFGNPHTCDTVMTLAHLYCVFLVPYDECDGNIKKQINKVRLWYAQLVLSGRDSEEIDREQAIGFLTSIPLNNHDEADWATISGAQRLLSSLSTLS